jgi:prolyl oligopeptidase PreP (S9A serine peptidase family)
MQANEALRKTWLDKDGEHAWLEEVESEAALKWVVEQNEAAVAALGE